MEHVFAADSQKRRTPEEYDVEARCVSAGKDATDSIRVMNTDLLFTMASVRFCYLIRFSPKGGQLKWFLPLGSFSRKAVPSQ